MANLGGGARGAPRLMPQSHIPDYGSRLRSDSATTRKVKKSDYYPQWSGMSYHCLNAVVYVRNRVLRIGNGPERSAKHSRQLGASRNIRETQPILCSRITIVTMTGCIGRNNVLCCLDGVWTVSCGTGMIWRNFYCRFLPIESRLRPDLAECEPSLPNPFRNPPAIIPTSESRNSIRLSPDKAVCNAVQQNVIGLRSDSVPIIPNMATVVGFQMRGFPDSAELLTSGV